MSKRSKLALCVGALTGMMLSAPDSLAQDSGLKALEALEEVTVTARKRSESVQNIPMAIDVFTARGAQGNVTPDGHRHVDLGPAADLGAPGRGPGSRRRVGASQRDPRQRERAPRARECLRRGRAVRRGHLGRLPR